MKNQTVSLSQLHYEVIAIAKSYGISNSVYVRAEYVQYKANDKSELRFEASIFVADGNCKGFSGNHPEVLKKRIHDYFTEQELIKSLEQTAIEVEA